MDVHTYIFMFIHRSLDMRENGVNNIKSSHGLIQLTWDACVNSIYIHVHTQIYMHMTVRSCALTVCIHVFLK